jgi:Fe2+ or Zn2+ uptake regulation protein
MKKDILKDELHTIGIKNTRSKAVILESLKKLHHPATANELHLNCSKSVKMNIATVYRTLQQFKEKGIVKDFLGSEGIIHYEYVGHSVHSHPHFQCERCHEFICLGELGFDDAIYFSNMAKRHKINSINITLSGVCEHCQHT